jgi:hypothetical protein
MTFIRVRDAAQQAAKQGSLTPHQAAALGRLDEIIEQRLTTAERQEVTELWRAAGSPAAPAGPVPAVEEWRTVIRALNLSQPDARTCQAACIGMAVGDRDIQGIRRKLDSLGSAGSPRVMAEVIRAYGKPYSLEMDASLAEVIGWLKAGEFLITHGWFTGPGHVICLDGLKRTPKGTRHLFDVRDPWGEFDFPAWKYLPGATFYTGFYSELGIYAACVAGTSAADASARYRAGVVNRAQGGMWVHRMLTA